LSRTSATSTELEPRATFAVTPTFIVSYPKARMSVVARSSPATASISPLAASNVTECTVEALPAPTLAR
jgi:hypothetical protein